MHLSYGLFTRKHDHKDVYACDEDKHNVTYAIWKQFTLTSFDSAFLLMLIWLRYLVYTYDASNWHNQLHFSCARANAYVVASHV